MLGCGHCEYCVAGHQHVCPDRFEVGIRDGWAGALAEQVLIPTRFAYEIPEHVSVTAAALVEPGGNALRAVRAAEHRSRAQRCSCSAPGRSGCSPPSSRWRPAPRCTSAESARAPSRSPAPSACRTRGSSTSSSTAHANRFDAVIEATSNERMPALSVRLAKPAGRVVYIGLSSTPSLVDSREIVLKDITAVGILSASPGLAGAIESFAGGAVVPDAIVSEVVALEEVPDRLEGRRGADAGPGPKVHVDPRLRLATGADATMNDEPTHADATEREGRLVGADRVIAVLTELAEHPLGITLDELAGTLQSSKPTVHRALATLRRAGLADLAGRGVYVLGDEYLRLAFRNLDGRPETARIQPLLEELAAQYGETAHYAVLSGTDIVYRAKMDPPQGAVRLTSVIGGRNPAYRTAVGKALLSGRLSTVQEVLDWFGDVPARAEDRRTR